MVKKVVSVEIAVRTPEHQPAPDISRMLYDMGIFRAHPLSYTLLLHQPVSASAQTGGAQSSHPFASLPFSHFSAHLFRCLNS